MTATGELLHVLRCWMRNRGGYRFDKECGVNDSLTLASRLWTESSVGAYALDFAGMDEFANPQFLEDFAEIVGTVRRVIPNDTLPPRLFNNRYNASIGATHKSIFVRCACAA